ncbi:hypothetical protein A9Q81_15615 [Gammaproteobacteria bacterium 42_54_T18]|nr:hypothetical protein A9Q81_15615 [Gammaproteobacteria bacterium 42_54_T18]
MPIEEKYTAKKRIAVSQGIGIVLISTFLAFGISVSLFLYQSLERDFGKIQQQDFNKRIKYYGISISDFIDRQLILIDDISQHPIFSQAVMQPDSLQIGLKEYMNTIRFLGKTVQLTLLDFEGNKIHSTMSKPYLTYNNDSWIKNILQSRNTTKYRIHQKSGVNYFSFAKSIQYNKSTEGVLLTEFPVDSDIFKDAWYNDEKQESLRLFYNNTLVLSLGKQTYNTEKIDFSITGRSLRLDGNLNNDNLLKTRDNIIKQFVTVLFLLSICAIFVIFRINKVLIIKPLQEIREATNQIAKGEFSQNININKITKLKSKIYIFKEISRLSTDIISMAFIINTREASLQDTNVILEKRVGERTEELQIAHDQALTASRAKSGFLATMSHEIRTPMNAVLGVLGLLKKTPLNKEQKSLVQTGRVSGELLLTIINDILDFSKMEADRLELENSGFNIYTLLDSTIELLKSQSDNKNINLELIVHPELPNYVKGDPDRLRQILINLISNAIKFTSCGSIKVIASTTSEQKTKGDFVFLCSVKDTGVGIPDEVKDTLFDEFTMADQTHSRRYEGTGLGLAICKKLVTLMGGEIHLTSEVGSGTTFTFTASLESAEHLKDEITRKHNELKLMPDAGTRILLAEDNPANQMLVKDILEDVNLHVDTVANGLEAIQAVRNRPYDLVLMDISMPEMDGMAATQEIRHLKSDQSNIPIIALTAHVLSGDRDRFIEAGMDDYLTKPIDRSETLHCIGLWSGATKFQNEGEENDTFEEPTTAVNEMNNAPQSDLLPKHDLVSEATISQLVRDTSTGIMPKLLTLYIKDARKRIQNIEEAYAKQDYQTLEFETHTLGSSAGAHSNLALFHLAREIEQLCQEQNHQKVADLTPSILSLASKSFELLEDRIQQGFK